MGAGSGHKPVGESRVQARIRAGRNADKRIGGARYSNTSPFARASDPPPVNWSILRYVFGHEKENRYAEEEAYARRDRHEAAAG